MRVGRRLVIAGAVAVILLAIAAWWQFRPGEAPPGQPPLATLDGVALEEFKRDFNDHADSPRLILLLSPT
jgi:hypothetical protein